MSKLTTHEFEELELNLRSIAIDGEPWFVAKDVCDALDLDNSRQALSRLDGDEKNSVILNDTSSNGIDQERNFSIVNESGLYSLIMSSRKPNAKKFKKWVTSIVLPSIRKTGGYQTKPLSPAEQMMQTAEFMMAQESINAEQKQGLVNTNLRILDVERQILKSPFRTGVRYTDDHRQNELIPKEPLDRKVDKKSRVSMREIGVEMGDTLEFSDDIHYDMPSNCTFIHGWIVEYNGRYMALGTATHLLCGNRLSMDHWMHNGRLLADIKREVLGK